MGDRRVEKGRRAQPSAYQFGVARRYERRVERYVVEKVGQAGKAVQRRRQRGDVVLAPAQMRTHARLAPIRRLADQLRPRRTERYHAQRRSQTVLLHHVGAKLTLPPKSVALG